MAKQPYIQFYIGDYIKDTRVLPLNVKGGWVDLILAMWDNDIKGEIIGTTEDFARIMNCTQDESILVIQTLKQKKIFAWTDLEDGQTKIISRKQKRMVELSKTRKKIGELGGNPVLVKLNDNQTINQKVKLNTEYENEYNKSKELEISNTGIAPEMFKIFKKHNSKYPHDKEKDFTSCLSIAYKIAESKGWEQKDVISSKKNDVLVAWEKIVLFASTDKWFSTRALYDLNSEWQRLIQSMNGKYTGMTSLSQIREQATSIKKEEETDFDKYKLKK